MHHFSKQEVFKTGAPISVRRSASTSNVHTHTHDFIEIVYIENGSGYHKINEEEFEVKKGDILFINYGKTHSFSSENGFVFYNILLTPEFVSEELINSENAIDLLTLNCFESFSTFSDVPKISFSADEIVFVENMISEMEKEYYSKPRGYEQALKGYITILLIHIFRKMDKGNILGKEKKIPAEILDYLDNNYNEKITVNALAERCFYNPSYFSRIFSETFGMSITDYVLEKRFKKACQLLSLTDMTVEAVATESGFRDSGAIFKYFKKKIGITPTEYRKSKNQQ